MSTIKASNIQNGSSSSVNIALNTDGSATFAQMPVGPSYFAMRNKIINGAMEIDQRGNGASAALSGSSAYPVDRFVCYTTSGSGNTGIRSTTAPTGFANSLLITIGTGASPSASSYNQFGQIIEGYNIVDLGFGQSWAKTVSVSFWVRASIAGTYCLALVNSATAGTRRSYVTEYSISNANTWEYKTITVPGDITGTWDTTNGQGLAVFWDIGTGSNYQTGTANVWANGSYFRTANQTNLIATNGATFYLTGVQLEVGSVATPFERRNYQQELGMCLRYYQTTYLSLSTAMVYAPTYGYVAGPMRTSPTFTATLAAGAAVGVAFYPYSNVSFRYLPTGGSGLGDYTITMSAEL